MSPILVVDKKESKRIQDSGSRFVSTQPDDSAGQSESAEDRMIQQALAGLQLPHSSQPKKIPPAPNLSAGAQRRQQQQVASVRIMVVADLDLASASALAEYAVQQKKYQEFDASLIDLCIACGPFCRDEDLNSYLAGRQQQICASRRLRRLPPPQLPHAAVNAESSSNDSTISFWSKTPFFRSQEETAALEGLMTAALSQLESIVCRVLYCPGTSDPLSTLATPKDQRLTPNSRNLHQQWMPLAPGLGCAGLFYLDGADQLVANTDIDTLCNDRKRHSRETEYNAYDEIEPDEETDEDDDDDDGTFFLVEQLQSLRQTDKYTPTLNRLLQLAPHNRSRPPPPGATPPLPFTSPKAQSVLLTHHVDVASLTRQADQWIGRKEGASPASLVNNISDSAAKDTVSSPDGSSSHPMPWKSDHNEFLANNSDLLCMEIASGAPWLPAKWLPHVLLPGSLRERGEFSVVELGLFQQGRTFAWKVANVDIHNVHALSLPSY